jgi:hypothetical protein
VVKAAELVSGDGKGGEVSMSWGGSEFTVITPKSSIERPSDIGVRAHTNTRIFIPEGGFEQGAVSPFVGPPFSGFFPAQFGLPAATFTQVYASGTKPPVDPTGGFTTPRLPAIWTSSF